MDPMELPKLMGKTSLFHSKLFRVGLLSRFAQCFNRLQNSRIDPRILEYLSASKHLADFVLAGPIPDLSAVPAFTEIPASLYKHLVDRPQ